MTLMVNPFASSKHGTFKVNHNTFGSLVKLFISFSISAYVFNVWPIRLPLHFFQDEDRKSCITLQNLVVQLATEKVPSINQF